jgi:integrase
VEILEATKASSSGQDFVFSITPKVAIGGISKFKSRLDTDCGVKNWRLHDLRRTVASHMARIGVAPYVIEKVLNHRSGQISGVAAVYNRHGYESEKRDALSAWHEALREILKEAAKNKTV